MEQGSFRCDVNVSINRPGEPPGTRCEIKNLNSVRFMVAAIGQPLCHRNSTNPFLFYIFLFSPGHEIVRQQAILTAPRDPSSPEPPYVVQETRGFDEHTFETFRLRTKEDAPDYRYMPDPNLGTLVLSEVSEIAIQILGPSRK